MKSTIQLFAGSEKEDIEEVRRVVGSLIGLLGRQPPKEFLGSGEIRGGQRLNLEGVRLFFVHRYIQRINNPKDKFGTPREEDLRIGRACDQKLNCENGQP